MFFKALIRISLTILALISIVLGMIFASDAEFCASVTYRSTVPQDGGSTASVSEFRLAGRQGTTEITIRAQETKNDGEFTLGVLISNGTMIEAQTVTSDLHEGDIRRYTIIYEIDTYRFIASIRLDTVTGEVTGNWSCLADDGRMIRDIDLARE